MIIDNLGAYLLEDVPLPETLAYCRNLRRLIDDLGLQSWTDLIVTSEYFSVTDFAADAARITTKGMGDTKPSVPNTTAAGRAQNRRVEVVKQ
jgi:hypothetical protein